MASRRVVRLWIVDAFARRAFGGNQAAVCLLGGGGGVSDAERQSIAAELRLAETAFVEVDDGAEEQSDNAAPAAAADPFASASRFVLRWFTPTTEAPLCGHATLAAAHVIAGELGNPSPALRFRTVRGAGELVVARHQAEDGDGGGNNMLEMSLPLAEPRDALPEALRPEDGQRRLAAALGLAWRGSGGGDGKEGAPPLVADRVLFAAAGGINYALVEASAPAAADGGPAAAARALRELPAPDPGALAACCPSGLAGVIVAVRGGEEQGAGGLRYRCTSRFFAPWMGIDEDSVTGSAHAVLGPHFDGGGGSADGDGGGGWWWARQASLRGGDVRVRVDRAAGRVMVAGEATVVVRGELELPPPAS